MKLEKINKYNQCEIVWQPLDCDFQPTDGSFCKYFMNGQCNPDKIVWDYLKKMRKPLLRCMGEH